MLLVLKKTLNLVALAVENVKDTVLRGLSHLGIIDDMPKNLLNLEDVFITGLAAQKCQVQLRNSQWFAYMGKSTKYVKKQDILIHGLKSDEELLKVYNKLREIYA